MHTSGIIGPICVATCAGQQCAGGKLNIILTHRCCFHELGAQKLDLVHGAPQRGTVTCTATPTPPVAIASTLLKNSVWNVFDVAGSSSVSRMAPNPPYTATGTILRGRDVSM